MLNIVMRRRVLSSAVIAVDKRRLVAFASGKVQEYRDIEMGNMIYLQYPGAGEPVAVATGFSWGACLLGFIWALSKRMWFAAFVMLSVSIILFSLGLWGETADLIGTVLSILFAIGCGMYGNQWHRWTLEKRGYIVL